jgi:AraC-like DNA-binding protein
VVIHEFGVLTRPHPAPSRLERAERDHRATALLLRLLGPARLRPHQQATAPSAAERVAREARRYIQEHACAIRGIDDIAQALGISHSHLRHVFKKTYGQRLVRELMEARIALAEEQLRVSHDPLAEIAGRCGLGSGSYLRRVYRRLRGGSPEAFRRSESQKVP